jgi:REP element-mobilizing transposase RayT
MSRPVRFVPGKKTLVEVTSRTIHGRFLLRPSPLINEAFLGVLGRAQELYGVGVCAAVCLGNHVHLLLLVDDAGQLARFMGYFNSNLAREAGRLSDWREKFWARRYRSIVISGEEAAQRERLKYVLANGCKEGLVEHPWEWPGVHSIKALLDGTPLTGQWFDRTQEYAARRRGEDFERLRFATAYTVQLSPLPCWEHLTPEMQRKRIAEIVEEVDAEAAAQREKTGKQPMGASVVQQQVPHDRPMKSKKSPAPLFHAASKRVRKELYAAYYAFLGAFREASERWRAGDRTVVFPSGSFPPAPRFVDG